MSDVEGARRSPGTEKAPRRRSTEHGAALGPAWPIVLVLAVVAIVVVGLPESGTLVADNRLLQFFNPSRLLARSLGTWSSATNFGRVTGNQDLVIATYSTLWERIGAPPWMIQRTFHVTVVGGGAIGAALVAREFLTRSVVGPLAAGLWWIASPFTAAFLMPSMLSLNAALTPWLVLAWLRGTTSPSRWRWAAVFALAVAISALSNAPGLVLAALPLVPLAAYLLWTRQATWHSTGRWLAATVPLVLGVSLFDLYRSGLMRDAFEDNLAHSENVDAVGRSSSWSESLRGLGNWLTYWNPSGSVVHHWLTPLMTEAPLVLLSFVPVIVAAVVVSMSEWRPRVLFGSIWLMSTALMVGVHPLGAPSPLGRLIGVGFDEVPALFVFRNLYKAGGGWALATSVLIGYAAKSLIPPGWWRGVQTSAAQLARPVGVAALVAAAVATSFPLWSGAIYERTYATEEPPAYWHDAIAWLDQQDVSSRVLILPGEIDEYRWGNASNGDLFHTFMHRPYVLDSTFAQPSPEASNLIHEISNRISRGGYLPGSIGPIADRLGIAHVVIRNDIRWEEWGLVRPAYLDRLRGDPDLRLVASFGEPGENVTRTGDRAVEVLREVDLQPVEIYEVRPATHSDPVRAVTGPSVLLSGDGAAWAILANRGHLDTPRPIRYTAQLTGDELTHELRRGAPVFVTDTNRRVPRRRTAVPPTLPARDANAADLFGREGSQSVAEFTDAAAITDLSPATLLDPGIERRPAAAFDRTERTAFLTGSFRSLGANSGLRVDLNVPTRVASVRLVPATWPGLRDVVAAEVHLSTGEVHPVELAGSPIEVTFAEQQLSWFEIRVTEIAGEGRGPWGFAEIEVPGLDLRERIRTPDDLARAADVDDQVAELLSDAPLTFEFERRTHGRQDLEAALLRTFRLPTDRELLGRGILRIGDETTDTELAELLGRTTYGSSTDRRDGSSSSSAVLAFDGDDATAWEFEARPDHVELDVIHPERTVSAVMIDLDLSGYRGTALTVDIAIDAAAPTGGAADPASETSATIARPADCTTAEPCAVTLTAPLSEATTRVSGGLSITIRPGDSPSETDDTSSGGDEVDLGIVRVTEIRFDDDPNPPFPISVPETCQYDFAELDGEPLGIRLFAPPLALFDNREIAVDFCDPIALTAGWHSFTSGPSAPFSTLSLSAPGQRTPPEPIATPRVDVVRSGDTAIAATLDGGLDTFLVSGLARSDNWTARADGVDLGRPILLDAQMAWPVPDGGRVTVALANGTQRVSNMLAVVFIITSVACVALVITGPHSRRGQRNRPLGRPSESISAGPTRRRTIGLSLASVVVSGLIAGILAAALAALIWLIRRRAGISERHLGRIAVALIVLAAVATVPPVGPGLDGVDPEWPNDRRLAWEAARLAAVLLIISMSMALHRIRRPPPVRTSGSPTLLDGGGDDAGRGQRHAPRRSEPDLADGPAGATTREVRGGAPSRPPTGPSPPDP